MTVEEQLAAALAEVENLRMTIAEKDCMIQDLRNKFLWLRKKVFGQMSEKALPAGLWISPDFRRRLSTSIPTGSST